MKTLKQQAKTPQQIIRKEKTVIGWCESKYVKLDDVKEWLQERLEEARGNDIMLITNKNTFRGIVKATYIKLIEELE